MSRNPSEVWDQRFVPTVITTVQDLHVGSLQDIGTKPTILPMRNDGLITRGKRISYKKLKEDLPENVHIAYSKSFERV